MEVSESSRSNMLKFGWGSLASVAVALAIAAPSFAQNVISLGRNFRPDPATLVGNGGGSTSIASIAGIAVASTKLIGLIIYKWLCK